MGEHDVSDQKKLFLRLVRQYGPDTAEQKFFEGMPILSPKGAGASSAFA